MTVVNRKLIKIIICTIFLLCITATSVQAAEGEGGEGANRETPAQVVVEVIGCVIFLRVLSHFKLP